MRKFPWSPVLPLLFLFLSTGLHVIEPTFVEQLRHRVFDEYQRLKPREYSNDIPVRILDIDDESLSRIGQWPWPRHIVAAVHQKLVSYGAGVVNYNILFAEPDRMSGVEYLKSMPMPNEYREQLAQVLLDTDGVFALIMKDSANAILMAGSEL